MRAREILDVYAVGEQLPDDEIDVLAYSPTEGWGEAYLDSNGWHWGTYLDGPGVVTHWAHLPAAPDDPDDAPTLLPHDAMVCCPCGRIRIPLASAPAGLRECHSCGVRIEVTGDSGERTITCDRAVRNGPDLAADFARQTGRKSNWVGRIRNTPVNTRR